MGNHVKEGDRVKFKARGQEISGVVTNVRYKENRALSRLVRQRGMPDIESGRMVATVQPDEGGAVWTVPATSIRVTGTASAAQLVSARGAVMDIKNKIADRLHQRAAARQDAADKGGMYDLKPGDKVSVKFTNGPREGTFRRLSNGGQVSVRFQSGYSISGFEDRWFPAQFVSKV